MSVHEIARRFDVTTKAVNYAIQRQLDRLNKEAMLAYPEMVRLELERLDALQAAIWPLTQHRKVMMPDGSEMTVEPDLKAVAEVRAIMAQRTKLLGMDSVNINLDVSRTEAPQRAVLADAADRPATVAEFDPQTEAIRLIELMGQAGVLPAETVHELLGTEQPALPTSSAPIEDAEVITPDEVIR